MFPADTPIYSDYNILACPNSFPRSARQPARSSHRNFGLVFTTDLAARSIPETYCGVVERAPLLRPAVEGVDVHTLRHSAAVAWLESGVHIKAVADLLGHSSIAITGDIYGHTSDPTTRAAIDGLSGALGL